jgi:transposase
MRKKKTTSKQVNNKKHPGGRPTKYKTEFVEQVYKLTLEGYTDKDIADFYNVREQTVNNWKNAHPEFFESLKRGKDDYDSDVIEKSLAKRAAGYQYTETTKAITGKDKKITTKEVVKEVAPDPTSMIFWLKNRSPDRWRDKQSIELGVKLEDVLAALPKDFADKVRESLAKSVYEN